MLRTSELEYELDPGRIALRAVEPRDSARLMVARRAGDGAPEHRVVRDLPEILAPGDVLVFNTTRVLPARFLGVRRDTGGHVEGLYLGDAGGASGGDGGGARWVVLLKSRRRRAGVFVDVLRGDGAASGVSLRLVEPAADEPTAWVVEVEGGGTSGALRRVGLTPIPPYIQAARKAAGVRVEEEEDRRRYQTVYARGGEWGSVAAPTAGLHFTPELLARLAARGVERAEVELAVGTGTFRVIETEFVEQHAMHAEWCRVPPETARAVGSARRRGGRVIAVGTTAARAIESPGYSGGEWFQTRLLVTPGYAWRDVAGLMTNFHLPRSTLLAMVGAMFEGGVGRAKALYAEAARVGYRFYSYGDAMLILP